GRTIKDVRRRGKNILIDLSGGLTIRVHLRISGDLEVRENGEDSRFDRVIFQVARRRRLVFSDPRALGVVHIHATGEVSELLAGLGPEPLSAAFTLYGFLEQAVRSRQPAKLFLMDQRRVAGLGNIYAAEALYHAGIHPSARMSRLAGLGPLHTSGLYRPGSPGPGGRRGAARRTPSERRPLPPGSSIRSSGSVLKRKHCPLNRPVRTLRWSDRR
ncbi:MAG: DNA-formamidopyrimidine glycosylase family protein, partial [Planctomycetota bacterium]